MATELHLDPELAAVVEHARRRARETGELPRGPVSPFQSSIPPEARTVIAAWLRDGGYEKAVARIAAEDPDLANL
ncbi:MAG: hypothetical protein ACRDYY_06535 [Acidimicrobiales bacterium]